MNDMAPLYRRAWVLACCLALLAGTVFAYLHRPQPQDVSSTDVVPYLSSRSLLLIANAPPERPLKQDTQNNLSIPVPAGASSADQDAFEQDYVNAAAIVMAQKRAALWIHVAEYVVGAWVASLLLALAASHWLPPPPAAR